MRSKQHFIRARSLSALLLPELPARWRPPPTFSFSPEATEVPGGSRAQLTVTTDVPGFLTLTLDGPSGSITASDRQEVHTAGQHARSSPRRMTDGAPLGRRALTPSAAS